MSTSMSFDLFKESVIQILKEKAGADIEVFSDSVKKNNGIVLTGIIIKEKNKNASPTIYIDEFYEEYKGGVSIKKIAEAIYDIFLENRYAESVDLSGFTDYDKAKKQIAFKLINREKNWKLLQEIPHRIFYNLAVVFYYVVNEPPFYGKATILITHAHLKHWEVEEEELYRNAMRNAPALCPARIENIENVMLGLLQKEFSCKELVKDLFEQFKREEAKEADEIPMYVLTNKQKVHGAACMLYPDVIRNFAKNIGKDLYILPSSVHEVILLPYDQSMMKESLLSMVTEINHTQVDECEVLADAVYFYSMAEDKLGRLC